MSNPLSNQGQPHYEHTHPSIYEQTELPNPDHTRYVGVLMEAITTHDRCPSTEVGLRGLFGLPRPGGVAATQALAGRVAPTVLSPSTISNDRLVTNATPQLQPPVDSDQQLISHLVGLVRASTRSLLAASSKRKFEEIQVDKEKQTQEAPTSSSRKRVRPMFPASSVLERSFSELGAEDYSPAGLRVTSQPNYPEKNDNDLNKETFSLLSQLSNSNSEFLNDLKREVPGVAEDASYGMPYQQRNKQGN